MELQKNDICRIEIEDIGAEGEGIGKWQGVPVFVKDAVPGDMAEVRITKIKKSYAYGRLEKVITPSPFRIDPPCPWHRQCGGCQIQAVSYEKQLEFKHRKVRNHLIRIAGIPEKTVDRILEAPMGMEGKEVPLRYRNKAQFPFGRDKEGNIITGFYAGRTHHIIANTDCLLGAEENKAILDKILDYMEEHDISPYDESTGRGLIRHVLIRKGFSTGQLMVCLVINGGALPKKEALVRSLQEIPGMTSVSINSNEEKTNVIMGRKTRLLWGDMKIEDTIGDIRFRISPSSFYQVNSVQTEKIYRQVLQYAGLTGQETVWDLYCGIGTISLFLAEQAGKVYGVETVPEAVEDARENARLNHIENVEFYLGKAEEILPEKYDKEHIRADVIVVDPPRKGCEEACLATMLAMQPKRIVYVSCDSATLARDMKVLMQGGYVPEKARMFDNFPNSVHVECVIMMQYCGKEEKK